MKWYQGAPMLHTLETMHISSDINKVDARFPVQTVLRPQSEDFRDYRGYAGRVVSGIFRPGDEITVMPSGFTSKIKTIDTLDGALEEAFAPMSISMTLEDDIDVMLCWLNNSPAKPRSKYTIKHTSNDQKAMIK